MNAQMPLTASNCAGAPAIEATTHEESFAMRHLALRVARGLAVFAMAFAAYLFISHFLIQSVKVVGTSMDPTLRNSQMYLLNRFAFFVRSPQPSDIVVLRDPADQGLSVKRIVARPGDTVVLRKGALFVNGKVLSEPYLPEGTITYPGPYVKEQTFTCAPGQFFVLGDNRMNSADSRIYGPVSRSAILGLLVH